MNFENTPLILSTESLNMAIGEQKLLNNTSFSIHQGERIGIVGRNGTGKSTLLKIISRLQSADSGSIQYKKDLSISYLPQEFTLPKNLTVEEILHLDIGDSEKWQYEVELNKIATSLSLPELHRTISSLSGGEQRRVHIAKVLLEKSDLLILDEPTNHIDSDTISWLENYISNYQGTMLFVTHDRFFLDKLSTKVFELSLGKIFSYQGNYTDYIVQKTERLETELKQENKRQNFLRREIKWIRSTPKARTSKSRSRIDRYFDKLNEGPPQQEGNIDLIIPPPVFIGNKILELKNVSFGYKEDEILIDNFTYNFSKNDKIGIIGKNGAGKTTLLKLIQEKLTPINGNITASDNLKFNYVDQTRLKLNNENTVYEEMGEGHEHVQIGKDKVSIWSYLKRFLFDDDRIKTQVKYLSGGEKGRLILAKLLKLDSNFLILDEPTNDLDLATLRLLEEALTNYKGTLIVVSHDRYFLDRICNGIISIEDKGNISYTDGNYSYYIEKQKTQINKKVNSASNNSVQVKNTKVKTKTRKLSFKEKFEFDNIEEEIFNLEDKISEIEAKFISPVFYTKFANEADAMNKELELSKKTLEEKYGRWEYLEKIHLGGTDE